jgi:hypothetical protein
MTSKKHKNSRIFNILLNFSILEHQNLLKFFQFFNSLILNIIQANFNIIFQKFNFKNKILIFPEKNEEIFK